MWLVNFIEDSFMMNACGSIIIKRNRKHITGNARRVNEREREREGVKIAKKCL